MEKFILTFCLLFSINFCIGQNIDIQIIEPNTTFVNKTFNIQVKVDSFYEVSLVQAEIEGKVVDLDIVEQNIFNGIVDFEDSEQGEYILKIIVNDVLGNIKEVTQILTYDSPSEIVDLKPVYYDVKQNGNVRIVFDAFDRPRTDLPTNLLYQVFLISSNGNTILEYDDDNNPIPIIESNEVIDQEFNLSEFIDSKVEILYSVTDASNQTLNITSYFFIETSQALNLEYKTNNHQIADFDGKKILSTSRGNCNFSLSEDFNLFGNFKITDITTSEENTINLESQFYIKQALFPPMKLIEDGILFSSVRNVNDNENYHNTLFWHSDSQIVKEFPKVIIDGYDSNDPTLYFGFNRTYVSGDHYSNYLLRQEHICLDLEQTPGTVLVDCHNISPSYFIHNKNDLDMYTPLSDFQIEDDQMGVSKVFDNGSILYYDDKGDIVFLENGVKTNITSDGDFPRINNTAVKTDGNLFVYSKVEDHLFSWDYSSVSTIFFDSENNIEEEFRFDDTDFSFNPTHYMINNGFVAYQNLGNLGQEVIMLRTVSGEKIRVSPFGSDSRLVAVNNIGEIIFQNDRKWYLYSSEGEIIKILNNAGNTGSKAYYKNDKWFINIGNSLFSVNSDTALSVNDISEKINFSIYPNPSTNTINIQNGFSLDIEKYSIYDFSGRKVIEYSDFKNDNNQGFSIDISGLKNGIYFLTLLDKSKKRYSKKLIKG
ncbi:T9SS type A sorting domain-containing protein [uncultured Aquimarina sp.]|uniref:T9SS type A sorting domain-containing protein n=1 Tax=uncultured Aquimarina sp. TaxID=575652 RepID=UPI0026245FEA|nr:T9SS type A sorting domain-containing protein [uncultured Aquimarina sp.]